jgi:hypothetical protein
MRLLERKPDGGLVLREFIGRDVPAYTILSHTWSKEEVSFQEVALATARTRLAGRR